jgi:hypothetical protein
MINTVTAARPCPTTSDVTDVDASDAPVQVCVISLLRTPATPSNVLCTRRGTTRPAPRHNNFDSVSEVYPMGRCARSDAAPKCNAPHALQPRR